jgi:signal transduction histidine kinase
LGLRTKVAITFCTVTLLGVGTTGAVLVLESAKYQEQQVIQQELLLAENRAFAMRSRIEVLLRELTRLSRMAEINLRDGDIAPERNLLRAAHQGSVLFNMAIFLVDREGKCAWSEPHRRDVLQRSYAREAWWTRAQKALEPFVVTEGGEQPTLSAIAPITDRHGFSGVLVGLIDLRTDQAVLSPSFWSRERGAESALVDGNGRVLLWVGGGQHADIPSDVLRTASERPGSVRQNAALYTYASVHPYKLGTIRRLPWEILTRESRAQLRTVLIILGAGVLLAGFFAVMLARGLTRPVLALAGQARDLSERHGRTPEAIDGRDELDTLRRAFETLEQSLEQRDRQIAADLEEIRRIAADRERLNVELRQLADELAVRVEARTRELQETQQALLASERLATIGKTAAALAHELRNALNGLSVATDLLAQCAGDRTSPMVRERAHREIGRLRDLTNTLLSFSGPARLSLSREDVKDLVRRAASNFYEDLRDQNIQLDLDFGVDSEPLYVDCDAVKIETVLNNLIRNAVEATAQARLARGAGDDEPEPAAPVPLRISARRAGGMAVVEILDRGVGLSESARHHLFEPFFTTKRTGTGLGLVTSQRFVEAHGGTIAVEGRVGGGSIFRIQLPLPETPAVAASAQ